MRPLRLKLGGFVGISRGQGKNLIEIDLTSIDETAALVAISGPNGAGKTTIIDNLHPYRVMPSHTKLPTPGGFSYYDHIVEGADAIKELTFAVDGQVYLATLRMKNTGKTKRQEAYLYVEDGQGGWKPFSRPETGLISDGKAETYDQCVEALCGKPEVFFSTAFSAQGKRQVAQMQTAEVKALMSSMQGNESLKKLSETAAEVSKWLKPELQAVQGQMAPLQAIALRESSLGEEIAQRASALTFRKSQADGVKNRRDALQTQIATLEDQVRKQESVKAQRQTLTEQLASLESQNAAQIANFDATQDDQLMAQRQRQSELRQDLARFEQQKQSVAQRITSCQNIIAKEPQMLKAERRLKEVRDSMSVIRASIDDAWLDENKLRNLRLMTTEFQSSMATIQANGISMKESLEAAMKIASLINTVPCKAHAFAGQCPLLEQARLAGDEIPQKEIQVRNLRNSYRTQKLDFESADAELQRLIAVESRLRALKEQESTASDEMSNLRDAIKDLPLVTQAKLDLQKAIHEQASLQAEISRVESLLSQAGIDFQNTQSKLTAARNQFVTALNAQADRIRTQIEELPLEVTAVQIQSVHDEFQRVSQNYETMLGGIESLELELQTFRQQLVRAQDAHQEIQKIEHRAGLISDEITQWTLLSRALGNDGIIAMSIDDAGPSISAICNQILEDCYGGRFVVRISTQEATATGVLKESFVIHVEDTLRGENTVLDMMSGGEKVWINECLVRAMALFLVQTSKAQLETLFSDESDGPLDPERKRQFMAMKRSVLARGGFKREYIITQTPELQAMCDEVIDVTTI